MQTKSGWTGQDNATGFEARHGPARPERGLPFVIAPDRGRARRARRLFRHARRWTRPYGQAAPGHGGETSAVALNLYNLAEVLVHQRKFDEARKCLREAVEIWEKAHPSDYLSLLSYTEAVAMVKRQVHSTSNIVNLPTRNAGKISAA